MIVKIVYFKISDYDLIFDKVSDYTCKFLTEGENQVFNKYVFKRDKINLLLGRIIVRKYLDLDVYDFDKNQFGKLNHKENNKMYFNISHTEGIVAVSFSHNQNTGVDVEIMRKMKEDEYISLLNYFASNDEKNNLFKLIDYENKIEEFYKIWTSKEAYLKALGIGLVNDLPKVCTMGRNKKTNTNYYSEIIENKYYLSCASIEVNKQHNEFAIQRLTEQELFEWIDSPLDII
ncbi:MAG: 4'-phosphopantetheinyl transferase superfamily protein [Candidatus Delongbacteria bacterium]|nr:4'-phosphopantetheinyl transferase superfamily protein [Candidatus Delongbacteria bacterium]